MATAPKEPKQQLGLAIVGCGQIVTHHLEALSSTNITFQVRALCDPSAERRQVILNLARSLHTAAESVQQYESLDAMIVESSPRTVMAAWIDVMFIAVPHDLHEPLALQALAIQPPLPLVVLEKPLAPTAAACDGLLAASLESHRRLVVAEQSPYWPAVQRARQLIIGNDRAIGTVISAAAYYYESMRDNITSGSVDMTNAAAAAAGTGSNSGGGGGLGWRGSLARAGGGIALDGGLHWIRPLRELCGRIDKVVGVVRTHLAPQLQMEGESLGHALLEISTPTTTAGEEGEDDDVNDALTQPAGSGPLIATYSCNMLATAPMAHDTCPYFRLTGNRGEIVIHGDGLFKTKPGAGGLRLYNDEFPQGREILAADQTGGFFLGFAGLWQEISRICVERDGAAAHETVVRAADDVRVVLALYKSSQTGRWESTGVGPI